MVKIIPYNPKLKAIARKLRKEMTFGEVLLRNELKENKLLGFDFDRQRCMDNYIVDFYCKELMLAIEVDGRYHNYEDVLIKDDVRQAKLESFGIKFLRFAGADVKDDLPNALRAIEGMIIEIVKDDSSIELPKDFDRTLLD